MVKTSRTRTYESPLRREQAANTRLAILDAARERFLAHGFARTTIRDIARAAGVSPETVYAVFGSKRELLTTLLDVAIAGDDEPVAILDRAWVARMRTARTIRRRLSILATEGARILERRAPVERILRSAAEADPAVAELRDRANAQRVLGQRALLRIVIGEDTPRLRPGLTETTAGDILVAIGSPETWHTLVDQQGWSVDTFRAWYVETLDRLLLR